MKKILQMAVEGAKRNGRHVGICGQAPSDHIEVARFLIGLGIDSISLTPDRVLKTMLDVQQMEVDQAKGVKIPPSPPPHPPKNHRGADKYHPPRDTSH